MVGKDKKTQFDMDILGKVDDEEVFKSFDWSTFFYTRLLNNLKTSLQGKKRSIRAKEDKKFESSGILQHQRCVLMKYSQLQVSTWPQETTIVKPKMKLSTQEKAFMESRIRGNDNTQMETMNPFQILTTVMQILLIMQ
ncbi:Ulp1-like peptidase [Cucumis melo var. makuwa]|uniref:Ulp1-like peptidase n=1 Tax=Cucumis melo var. makuwa TaxID=1194695 RepID=A0A5D3E3Z6_CUCMM|nr:Ulp1-like peptidase [Cucumis melo var. makuwa]TYK30843.1 Ulp1-like peptidase [Cucumis melo var. makuwa]